NPENLSPDELRTYALRLAIQRGRAQRLQAIRLLEDSETRFPLNEEDQFALAQILESVGEQDRALARYSKVCDANPENPRYLGRYLQALLRKGDVTTARDRLGKLKERIPKSLMTRDLEVRILQAMGKTDEA